jgi:hypothetical protein
MHDWPSNWILSAEYAVSLTSPDLVRSRVITFRMGPPRWSCSIHKYPIRGVFPNPQVVDGAAKRFFARIAVPPLKRGIYVQEPSFLQSRDGKGIWAGTKDFLKLLRRKLSVSFRLSQRVLCFVEIRQPPL